MILTKSHAILCRQDDINLHACRQCSSTQMCIYKCWAMIQQHGIANKPSYTMWRAQLHRDMDQVFFSLCQVLKKLKDERNIGGEYQIIDSFLAYTGCKAIMKITHGLPKRIGGYDIWRSIQSNRKKNKEEIGHWREDEIPIRNKNKMKLILQYTHRLSRHQEFASSKNLWEKKRPLKKNYYS